MATQNNVHPPERTYASSGEPGLLVCTWPKSQHMGENGVRYRDEVWTGIEYQVATSMIYDGMVNDGLSLVKSVNERYSPEKHNPYNEIECGDHYARAMASWGVMLALEDYYYNGPEKTLGCSPKINAQHFTGFFTAADAWANISQQLTGKQQTNTVQVAYGSVNLGQLQVTPLQPTPASVSVTGNGVVIPSHFNKGDTGKL